jgi:osmotically inducible lipoprotein OsmB
MHQLSRLSLVVALVGGLAACGQTTGDRAISGAGLGAAAGAGVGALTGTSVLGGAALGGVAGGAAGALTTPNTVNLGRPAWR